MRHQVADRRERHRALLVSSATKPRPRLFVGETFLVRVHCTRGSDFVSSFEGEVHDAAGVLVARTTMTIVHAEQPPN